MYIDTHPHTHPHTHTHTHTHTHIYIYVYMRVFYVHNKIIFYSQSAKTYQIDKIDLKSREIPSQRRFVHYVLVLRKCTVQKSG